MKKEHLSLLSHEPSPFVVNPSTVSEKAKELFSTFRDEKLAAYIERTPFAIEILNLLKKEGGKIVNDHVAIRTFKDQSGRSGREILETIYLSFGYKKEDNIKIEPLYLDCYWYEPPQNTNWPKVFISEQQVEKLPVEARHIIYQTIKPFFASDPLKSYNLHDPETADPKKLFELLENPPWNLTSQDYETLLQIAMEYPKEKNALQYSAWTLVHGHRWNHFTILLNTLGLKKFKQLEDLNTYVKENNLPLNQWNENEIQGSIEKHLKQSSTTSSWLTHTFSDGISKDVPGSFVEFIERFIVDGKPMRGFLASNATGIFGSTTFEIGHK